MDIWAELEALQQRLAKAPQSARILPNTRKRLFAILGDVGVRERDDYIQLWNLVLERTISSTNDLFDLEARVIADWMTNPNTGQARQEAGIAMRAWLAGPPNEAQLQLQGKGEEMTEQEVGITSGHSAEGLEHHEARIIAFTSFVLKGVQVNFTMREGATAESTIALLKEFGQVMHQIKEWGGVPILSRDALGSGNAIAASPAPAHTGPPKTKPTMPEPPPGPVTLPEGNGTESFKVESVTAQLSPNGNRYYTLRGGRCKKHGVSAWPEVAEAALEAITGYNPIGLDVGQPWNVSDFDITATGEVPVGKNFPTKIIGLK